MIADPSSKPIRLLFVSARPQGSDHIRFQKEQECLKRCLPAPFEVIPIRTASIKELREALIEHGPHIFHFAGHGRREGALLLEDAAGDIEPLASDILGQLFQALRAHYTAPYAVFLNACHSLLAAQAIAPHVPLVIGMAGSLEDDAALEFADAFYHALRAGSWTGAFQMGRLALAGSGQEMPQLLAWETVPEAPWQSTPTHPPLPTVYEGPVPPARLLTADQHAALIDFLASRYIFSQQREALLSEAFYYADPHLYQSIDRDGSPRDFAIYLVQTLEGYGHLPGGEAALVALLTVVRESVGTDWQAQIDEWRHQLGVPRQGASRRELEIAYLEQRLAVREVGLAEYTALAGQGQMRKRAEIRPRFIHHRPELAHLQRQAAETFRPVETEQRAFEDIVQGMADIRRAVLLGDPGAGKTTSLRKLEVEAIGRALADEAAPIPIFVPLGQWLEADEPLEAFIAGRLGILGDYLSDLLREKRALLLLDSLNEIPVGQQKEKVEQVRKLLRTHSDLVALITCRKEDDGPDLDLTLDRLEIAPLDPPRILEFTQKYLGEEAGETLFWAIVGDKGRKLWGLWQQAGASFEAFWNADEGPQSVSEQGEWGWESSWYWREQVRTHRAGLLPLARNPYLLLMLVAVQESSGGLPKNQGALFEMFAETLLLREGLASRREAGEVLVNAEGQELLAALTNLAFTMQSQQAGPGRRGQQVVTALGRETVFPALLSERQGYLARCATLLEGEETIRFSHQLLQEYFAARYMKEELEAGRLQVEAIWQREEPGKRTGWEEATVLLAGLYSDDCTRVVEWVERVNPEVAAVCLVRSGAEVRAETRKRLQAMWLQRLTNVVTEPDPRVRAAAGRALAVSGLDNRAGVGLRADGLPDMAWVEIPGGKCQIGGDEGSRHSLPAQEVDIPTFWIAKYPVTNWQWAAFVADGGCVIEEWWEGLEKPEPVAPSAPSWDYGNHPRKTSDWCEATAFCRWLSARLGYEVRLPTEEEWEKAARGAEGRIYPWGDKYVSGYANINETGGKVGPYYLQQTSAVGLYPQGASPEGAHDLSGNVSEWCLTNVSGLSRVLRGGSWIGDAQSARAASLDWDDSLLLWDDWGFRVACVVPAVSGL